MKMWSLLCTPSCFLSALVWLLRQMSSRCWVKRLQPHCCCQGGRTCTLTARKFKCLGGAKVKKWPRQSILLCSHTNVKLLDKMKKIQFKSPAGHMSDLASRFILHFTDFLQIWLTGWNNEVNKETELKKETQPRRHLLCFRLGVCSRTPAVCILLAWFCSAALT